MKTVPDFYIYILAFIAFSCSVEKKASKSFELGQYQWSLENYQQVLAKDPTNAEASYYIAEAYRFSNRAAESAPYYEQALENGLKNDSIRLNYAFALKANGKYQQAKQELATYLKTVEDEQLQKRAEEEYSNLNNIDILREKENYYRVKSLDDINTPGTEYSPTYSDGHLYFTTTKGDNKIYSATGTPFTNIFRVKTNGAKINVNTFESLGDQINNSNINEGSVAFSPDGRNMVFARGNSGKKKGTADVNLYITSNRNGTWTEPRLLNINNPGYWDSSPAFSRDGKTLYFASNRPGGYGGTDIYSAKQNSRGRFFDVTNLGPEINTTGNEMFPYIADDGRMYFSSDGHLGFGGLDIFVATRSNGRTVIENMGEPLNSNADDFGIFFYRADRGFFSSNRSGGMGDDDIYTFLNEDPDLKIVNYFLRGVTMTRDDKGELKILPGVEVEMRDYKGDLMDRIETETDGKFLFRVYEHERYNLIGDKKAGKDQYLITRQAFTTIGKAVDRTKLKELVTDIVFDTLLVLEKIEKNKIFVLENIYYDLDKWDIRDDAALELDKLVTILEDNPDLKIELSSHTDARADDDYNIKLSDRRARSAVDYIVSQGIASERLTAKGYGETQLIIKDATTEEEHQVNRRTEFKILETGNKLLKPGEFDEDRFFDDEDSDEN